METFGQDSATRSDVKLLQSPMPFPVHAVHVVPFTVFFHIVAGLTADGKPVVEAATKAKGCAARGLHLPPLCSW